MKVFKFALQKAPYLVDHTESLLKDLSQNEDEEEDSEFSEICGEIYYQKARQLLTFEEAPGYIKHNVFIRSGYRGFLTTELCKERYELIFVISKFYLSLRFLQRVLVDERDNKYLVPHIWIGTFYKPISTRFNDFKNRRPT